MINNTSNILSEKYIDKIRNDTENAPDEKDDRDNSFRKSVTQHINNSSNALGFKTTFEVFSNRYSKVPKKKVKGHDTDDEMDETDEHDALSSKQSNVAKLKTSVKMNQKKMIEEEEERKNASDITENKGTDVFTFFFHGLSIYFINDYKDNFYPVLCLSLKETNYGKENRIDGSFVSQSHIEAEFDYYNIQNGYWEPFIEGLDIEFQYDKQMESKVVQIKGKESINLNISPQFVSVLNYCLKSWEEAQKTITTTFGKNDTSVEPMSIFSEEMKMVDDSTDIRTEERSTLFSLEGNENVVDVATPYKIMNLTGMTIFVETLFDGKAEKYILHDSQTTKIAISYEKQTRKNFDGVSSKMNDDVRVQFQGLYLPIQKISLNKLGQNVHKLTENEDDSETIYFETKVNDMNKVLTLRTKNLLINSTQFSYDVILKNPVER